MTKHGKERVIKPVFEKNTGCRLLVDTSFDTDLLGTFTREVPRKGTQLEVARRKARKGMELKGLDLGLASEGSFGPHPMSPFLPWNLEMVLLLDSRENLEICGEYASSQTNYAQITVTTFLEAEEFARRVKFPTHHLVLQPEGASCPSLVKGIDSWEGFKKAFQSGLLQSPMGKVFLETDMRAHANPDRMVAIQKATEDLIRKIKEQCPMCSTPGFSVVEKKRGLPCEVCGLPTREVSATVVKCTRCGFTEERKEPADKKAAAGRCDYCNP